MPNREKIYATLTELCSQYGADLVAVSKTRTIKEIDFLYSLGQRVFAENRAQELIEKAPLMSSDIAWHIIGHLQTNKVKWLLPHITCIQSLDSVRLWDKIQEEAVRINVRIPCLLQIKIATEATKYGWAFDELNETLQAGKHNTSPNVKVEGVMGMASLTDDADQVRQEMKRLKEYFDLLKTKYFQDNPSFATISLGMSGDYRIALEEGSTMIRIGSLLFSE